MLDFAAHLVSSIERHYPELVSLALSDMDEFEEEVRSRNEPITPMPHKERNLRQIVYGMREVIREALDGDERGPKRAVFMESLYPGLRSVGVPLTHVVPTTSGLFVHVTAMCLIDLPDSMRNRAQRWLAAFARRYVDEMMTIYVSSIEP
jgi:hypothetical protein